MPQNLCDNLSVNECGHLCLGGQDTVELAKTYGTPLYLMDEERIRRNCRVYTSAFERNFVPGSRPLYASKACSFMQIYRIMAQENMGIDVVSAGEIHTASRAGFPMENAYFHSNNKTGEDIALAMEKGVGTFVADNREELLAIQAEAAGRGKLQKVMLRLTPGIDPHTYEAVNTGKVDSKFGTAIPTGQARELVAFALQLSHVELVGFHCHVGSQVFGEDVFQRAAAVMLQFIAEMRELYGLETKQLNMGGGYGVRYSEEDPTVDIGGQIDEVAAVIHQKCEEYRLPEPAVMMEPGRSIVADAGLTLYCVGTVKHITGYKTYVSVDGGMTDNPRYALYGAKYTCYAPAFMGEQEKMACDLVGRCCESGDIIQPHVSLPKKLQRGDLVAVCTTGAYNYSMASNYNRIPRPPVVMLRKGESYVAVRRETAEDMLRLDN